MARNTSEIPAYCGECRFFNRNTCYSAIGHYGYYNVNKYTPSCSGIKNLQGGYTNSELWNDEARTLREQGRYSSEEYLKNRPYEI